MSRRIILVEDDESLRESYTDLLEEEGFEVTAFDNRQAALTHIEQPGNMPDCFLLDITLYDEKEGGFQLCTDIRNLSKVVPIIFLTSHDGELDRVSALRLDADEFLNKKVSIKFLTARIEALLRRIAALQGDVRTVDHENIIERGPLHMDIDRLTITWKGQKINLTLTQFWILKALVERVGHIRSHDQLMKKAIVATNTIAVHIKTIREQFREVDDTFDAIQTVRGIGYRWQA